MKTISFTNDEIRVIVACMQMTGGNEINQHIHDKKMTEFESYNLFLTALKKLTK